MNVDWPYEFPGLYWFDDAEDDAVREVVRARSPFRYYGLEDPGMVAAYEAAAREYYGVSYALAVNSGTGALACALAAFGIGPGCEVIVPSFMWVATVGTIVGRGAIPVLCEVDESFTMNPRDLENRITPRTKLIVPVHMAGAPTNMDPVMAVANRHGIPVLEDTAQCNGGSWHGRKLGTIGTMGAFSLQINKNMTAGEGGLIITDDETLYQRAFAAHDTGMIREGGRPAMPAPANLMWGEGRRMSEFSGAVATVQLGKLDAITGAMRASAARIRDGVGDIPNGSWRTLNDPAGETGTFVVIILDTPDRAADVTGRLKSGGLHNVFRVHEYGLHIYYNIPTLTGKVPCSPAGDPWNHPGNEESVYDYRMGACPESDDLFARSVIIPVPSRLTTAQEDGAVAVIREAVGR